MTTRHQGLLVVAAVLMAMAAPTWAKDAATAPAKDPAATGKHGENDVAGRMKDLTAALSLTDEQQPKVLAVLTEEAGALKTWQQENGGKRTGLQEQAKQAKASGDKEAARNAQKALRAVDAGRDQIVHDAQAKIQAILTPDQQVTWQVHELEKTALAQMKALTLTDDQLKRVHALAADAAKQLGPSPDTKAGKQAVSSLHKSVVDQVLTPDQRTTLEAQQAARKAKTASP